MSDWKQLYTESMQRASEPFEFRPYAPASENIFFIQLGLIPLSERRLAAAVMCLARWQAAVDGRATHEACYLLCAGCAGNAMLLWNCPVGDVVPSDAQPASCPIATCDAWMRDDYEGAKDDGDNDGCDFSHKGRIVRHYFAKHLDKLYDDMLREADAISVPHDALPERTPEMTPLPAKETVNAPRD